MRSGTESLWLFALASKCKSLTSINMITLVCLLGLAWFLKCLFHWAHPGGPAWGKHRWRRSTSTSTSNFKPTRVIPGPRGLPLIGSMNLMTGLAHHKIAAAAQSFCATRLMAFSLGETRVIVTCNPEVAKKILNSSVFADRPVKESAYSLMFNRAIGFAPHGIYWKTLRKIASNHLFCGKQIRGTEGQRAVISDHMVKVFSDKRTAVCVRDVLKHASLYNMMWSVFGRRYGTGMESMELELELVELKQLVDQGYQLLGILNWTDHLPWLTDFDPQGVRFKCAELVPKVNRFVSRIIQEHRAQLTAHGHGHGHGHGHDFTDVLLSLQGPEKLSDSDMIAVLWEMIFRGTDTVAVLMEWILARMVLHRHAQSKVQNELDRVVGRSRAVTESDITKLVYLPAVVKEVLRLHPPGPLLSWARLATADTDVDGYQVPAGSTAMVNMWAITRDPDLWKDPLQFRPERFLEDTDGLMDLSVMGSDLRLAPFGSGRRSCPGKTLGLTTVSFWVASLLHEFEFETESEVDLSEELKLSCEMANPLVVNLRTRRMSTSVSRAP